MRQVGCQRRSRSCLCDWNDLRRSGVKTNMRAAYALSVCFLLPFLFAQAPQSNLPNKENRLATVSIRPDRLQIHPGEDLGVEVTITAGPDGAYLPNFFGDFDETCHSGFYADIFTLAGKPASDAIKSCAVDELFGGPDPPARTLLSQYVLLKPGESRRWHTTLTKITKFAGTYEVRAGYMSSQNRIREVAALPEVGGRMVVGEVFAKPVRVRIE